MARSPADIIRSDSFSRCDRGAVSCLDQTHPFASPGPQRLCRFSDHGNSHVRGELHAAVLGGASRGLRACCGVAGDHSNFRHDFRALEAAGRTAAFTEACRRNDRTRWRRDNLRQVAWVQWPAGFLGRRGCCCRRCERGVRECARQGALHAACARDAGCLADDLRSCAIVAAWVRGGRKPGALSLDLHVRVLSAVSRCYWIGFDVFTSLLAAAAPPGRATAKYFAHHPARSGDARVVVRRRNVSALILVRRWPCPCRRMDHFPKSGCLRTADSGRLSGNEVLLAISNVRDVCRWQTIIEYRPRLPGATHVKSISSNCRRSLLSQRGADVAEW